MPIVELEWELFIPKEFVIPQWVADKWLEGLSGELPRMKDHIDRKLPDSQSFESRVAARSADGYRPMVNPSFHTKSGLDGTEVVTNQEANLRIAFDKFKRAIDFVYETVDGVLGKRIKERLTAKKQNLLDGLAKRGAPFTGIAFEMAGACAIAVLALTGDKRVNDLIRSADKLKKGGPFLITPWRRIPYFKPAMMPRLTQAGVQIVKANYSATTMTVFNTLINQEAQSFVDPILGIDPFVPGGSSHIDYVRKGEELWLEVKVSRV